MLTLGYRLSVPMPPRVTRVNGRHSDQAMPAWTSTATAAVVACLPPAALATGLGCAGLGLTMDSSAIAAGGAVAATVGMVAQRSNGRRLRRRLRQERARNRLEVHDLEIRLEQVTRHLAEAVALAEAATRAMSGAPLVLTADGAVVAKEIRDAAAAAPVPAAVPSPVAVAARTATVVPPSEADTEIIEAVTDDVVPAAEPVAVPTGVAAMGAPAEPALPRRAGTAAAVSEHLRHAARANAEVAGRVAARLQDPAAAFGNPVVPATPAELFTPANGLPTQHDDTGWFSPVRTGLPPAPVSPAVGITLGGPAVPGGGLPPVPREPVSGAIALVASSSSAASSGSSGAKLPPRLADAKVVDLSQLAHPAEPALIVVRRSGRHAAVTEHVA